MTFTVLGIDVAEQRLIVLLSKFLKAFARTVAIFTKQHFVLL